MEKGFEDIEKEVELRVKAELSKDISENTMGYHYHFEKRKKEILKQEYNIDWKTSAERNPGLNID